MTMEGPSRQTLGRNFTCRRIRKARSACTTTRIQSKSRKHTQRQCLLQVLAACSTRSHGIGNMFARHSASSIGQSTGTSIGNSISELGIGWCNSVDTIEIYIGTMIYKTTLSCLTGSSCMNPGSTTSSTSSPISCSFPFARSASNS